jgi:hypothetical protein
MRRVAISVWVQGPMHIKHAHRATRSSRLQLFSSKSCSAAQQVSLSTMAHHDVEKETTLKEEFRHDYTSSQDDYECEFTPAEQKKIIHRIDRRLVLTVGILYCISLMDRTNLSSAAIAGFVQGLPHRLTSLLMHGQHERGVEA